MNETFIGDPSLKDPVLISSLPANPGLASFASGTILANNQLNIIWTAEADRPQLSLWNFGFTLFFGANDTDHIWPNGSALTTNQVFTDVSIYTDLIGSSDYVNRRQNKIVIRNESPSTWPFFLYYKAYTFSSSVGTNT